MLWLKRNTHFNELYKCGISDEFIGPGDYYYEDDEDGLIVKATVYRDMERQKIDERFDYSKLNATKNRQDYINLLKQAEKEYFTATLLDRKVANREDKFK